MTRFVEQPETESAPAIARHMLRFFRSAVTSGMATAIAHPFLPFGFFDHYDAAIAAISDGEFLDVFGAARGAGVAIEITVGFLPAAQPRWQIETPMRVLSLAKEAGCKFTFGSDAHSPARQNRLPELEVFVRELDLTRGDILTVSDLPAWKGSP